MAALGTRKVSGDLSIFSHCRLAYLKFFFSGLTLLMRFCRLLHGTIDVDGLQNVKIVGAHTELQHDFT